ncbi:hypothetical protein PSN45_001272 [Yamadazyma tenuis]|nr:hypothetical protein PSN45_001272 [Yamadazyma tenuis]
MSQELSKAVDQFLAYTDIQSQHYGVPVFSHVRYGAAGDKPKHMADAEYTQKYNHFIKTLDTLSYYHEMKQLRDEQLSSIDTEYEYVIGQLPIVSESPSHEEVLTLLKRQISLKTDTLLNSYLQVMVPILRSLFHVDSNLTSSEINISRNLKFLFSKENENSSSNIHKLMQEYNINNQLSDIFAESTKDLADLYETIRPKLIEVNRLIKDIEQAKSDNLIKKSAAIKESLSSLDEKTARRKFSSLIKEWITIVSLANFLPNFIMCLPLNWYDDKVCFSIIKHCGKISEQFDNYLHLINKNKFEDLTIDDLLMIDLNLS